MISHNVDYAIHVWVSPGRLTNCVSAQRTAGLDQHILSIDGAWAHG